VSVAQVVQLIVLVARLTGQPADLMVELARAESGLEVAALADQALVDQRALAGAQTQDGSADRWAQAVEAGASGGLYCLQWQTARWAAERVGIEIAPNDLADPWLNAFLAAKLLDWGYGGYFHAMERVPADVRPRADDPMFRNAPMWNLERR
jgi:hypothetical protein